MQTHCWLRCKKLQKRMSLQCQADEIGGRVLSRRWVGVERGVCVGV